MIRAADNPVRPGSHARPASPGQAGGAGRPAEDGPADVYVYRDTSEAPDSVTAAPGQRPDERDASYWYDLSGADSPPVDSSPLPAETRGPFEPLVSSSDPVRVMPAPAPESGPAPSAAQGPPNAGGDAGPEDSAPGRTSKLEQIREFYLTAEAIGEQNVAEHYDQLLAQQHELISEYFKQPPAAAQARPGPPQVP